MKKKKPSLKALEQVAKKLFESVEEQERFKISILEPLPKPTALLWMKSPQAVSNIEMLNPPDSYPEWITLCSPASSPGKSSEHERGLYYCLDPSSVACLLPLLKLFKNRPNPKTIVDFCASPGGKSIFAFRAFEPDWMICNETVGNRIPALLSNLKRCGVKNAIVTQADSSLLADKNPACAELVIVDAPCSGQSLCAKSNSQQYGCFSKHVINANVGRQRRILAEASKVVKPGGFLLYSTCTFSPEENENNVIWFTRNFPEYEQLECGRVWPADGDGAGSFHSILKKSGELESQCLTEFDLETIRHWRVFERDNNSH